LRIERTGEGRHQGGPGRERGKEGAREGGSQGGSGRARAREVQGGARVKGGLLRHGRDVHPAWVNVVTAALATKVVRGQVTRAEIMLR
jgi:hypothetical protein